MAGNLDRPLSRTEESEKINEFIAEIREFLTAQKVNECLPESSKLLLLDDRTTIPVAMRALDQYKKPFGCVMELPAPSFTNIIDQFDIIAFYIHLCFYYTSPAYISRMHKALSAALNAWKAEDANASDTLEQNTHKAAFRRNLRWITQTASDFDLRSFESAYPGPYNHVLADRLESKNQGLESHESKITPSTIPDSDDIVSACSSQSIDRRTFTDADSSRNEMERILGAPWDCTLSNWKRLIKAPPMFPHIYMEQTALEVAELLISSQQPRIIAWDEDRGSPFSFFSHTSLIGYLVQNLRSDSEVLCFPVISRLKIGIPESNLRTVNHRLPLIQVLRLFRDTRWSSIPVVDDSEAFAGIISVSQLSKLILKSLDDNQYPWGWNSTLQEVWPLLLRLCDAQPASSVHCYESNGRSTSGHKQSQTQVKERIGETKMESKLGSVFLSKLKADMEVADGGTSVPLIRPDVVDGEAETPTDSCCELCGNLPMTQLDKSLISNCEDALDNNDAAIAMQILVNRAVCSAAVLDDDLSLRQAIAHLVFTGDRRIVFLHPETRRIKWYITPSAIMQFLIGTYLETRL